MISINMMLLCCIDYEQRFDFVGRRTVRKA